jgi:hypothetical protein
MWSVRTGAGAGFRWARGFTVDRNRENLAFSRNRRSTGVLAARLIPKSQDVALAPPHHRRSQSCPLAPSLLLCGTAARPPSLPSP